jgi:hypothetical protein
MRRLYAQHANVDFVLEGFSNWPYITIGQMATQPFLIVFGFDFIGDV